MKRAASAVLISETDIQRRVSEMGAQISRDYKGGSLIVVGILKGSFIFIADLIRSIDDSILLEVEFIRLLATARKQFHQANCALSRMFRVPYLERMCFSSKILSIRV